MPHGRLLVPTEARHYHTLAKRLSSRKTLQQTSAVDLPTDFNDSALAVEMMRSGLSNVKCFFLSTTETPPAQSGRGIQCLFLFGSCFCEPCVISVWDRCDIRRIPVESGHLHDAVSRLRTRTALEPTLGSNTGVPAGCDRKLGRVRPPPRWVFDSDRLLVR